MAVGGGERIRMPRVLWCLTIARWIVATVVAAVAATVLLLVLTVGLRSETISVSVNHGHFQVATSLWSIQEFKLTHYPEDRAALPMHRYRTDTLAVYTRANHVDIWVSMDFKTPGCNGVPRHRSGVVNSSYVTTVSVFDMPNAPSFLGMVRIGTVSLHREVCRFYPGVLDRWIRVNDTDTLDYIAKTYGGRSEFTAMLQVNTNTTINETSTTSGVETKTTYHKDTHYCWPVTIGHSRSITADKITCKHSRGIDYTAGSGDLWTPPPAPDNSPPPPQICQLCGQN